MPYAPQMTHICQCLAWPMVMAIWGCLWVIRPHLVLIMGLSHIHIVWCRRGIGLEISLAHLHPINMLLLMISNNNFEGDLGEVWMAYKESSWLNAFTLIVLLICFGFKYQKKERKLTTISIGHSRLLQFLALVLGVDV